MHQASTARKPGRVISIVGLVFAFVGLAVVGLILSVIGLITSKRAGKTDVIAILGVVFNAIGIVVGGIVVLLVVVAYGNIQASARDTQRQTDVSVVLTAIDQYRAANRGAYPATDPEGFRADITSAYEDGSDLSVLNRITAAGPSTTHKDDYGISPCGNGDVTGIEVSYYDSVRNKVQSIATGSGCSAPQNGSPDDPSSRAESDL